MTVFQVHFLVFPLDVLVNVVYILIRILPGVLPVWGTSGENFNPALNRRGFCLEDSRMAVDRAAIFIDAGYLEKVIEKEFARTKIDYGKLAVELAGGKELLRTYYYNCPPYQSDPPTTDEMTRKANADKFYVALKKLPRFEVRLGRLAKRCCDKCSNVYFQQKRADLMLGVDLVNLSAKEQISTAILVAGDSDFMPAVVLAKDNGVLIHLYHGGPVNRPHADLLNACDDRTQITQVFIDKIKRA